MSFISERQQEIRESILKFLEAQSVRDGASSLCPYCGKAMSVIPATFSLCGTELTRTVHVPACDCRFEVKAPKIA
jgi:predicted amidophosphoribosyltransferase